MVLEKPQFDWYYREGAIEVLSTVFDPETLAKLEKVNPSKQPLIAEGICMAFGKSKNKERLPYMFKCLKSKSWVVRRAAARCPALRSRQTRDRPLDYGLGGRKERFQRLGSHFESLEILTRKRNLSTVEMWRGWWDANKDTFEMTDQSDELSEEEKSGEMVKTRSRGVNINLRSRGRGLPLLVLPDYSYDQNYLETYLRDLEDTSQILYVRLPGAADFTDPPLKAEAAGLPIYPLQRVADAFEGLQKDMVKQGKVKGKFAILAHGMSCWIAMKFAAKYPRAVRRMILVAGHSSSKASSEGIDNLVKTGQRLGDIELEHYGLSRQIQNGQVKYKAKPGDEEKALNRKAFTARFGDQRNLEISRLYGPLDYAVREFEQGGKKVRGQIPKWARPMGGCIIPNDFKQLALRGTKTPTLVVVGKGAIEAGNFKDGQAMARFYGSNGRFLLFKKSGEMPFIEENELFVKIVRKFLGGKRIKKRKRKRRKK